jgi:hypothetical protein
MAAPVIAKAAETASKTKWGQVAIGVAVIGGTVVAALVTVRFLQLIQVIDTKEERKAARAAKQLKEDKAINPIFWKKNPQRLTISKSRAIYLAKELHRSMEGLGTSEDVLFGAVKAAGSDYNMSYVSDAFQTMYQGDLLTWMEGDLSESDLANVKKIIDNYKR